MMMKSLLLFLLALAPAMADNMDATSTLTPQMITARGEPMCCEMDMQCMNGHCNYDDVVKFRIPAPIVVWSVSCSKGDMMSGWCATMSDPPSGGGGGITPKGSFGAIGDPHFKTWTGEWFDFHGECDLVLVNAPSFHNGLGLQIQIRTKIRYGYSYIETAGVKIGEDVLVVSSFGDYAFNSVQSAVLPKTMAGFPISFEQRDAKTSFFRIHLDDSEDLVVKTFKDMVNVNVNGTRIEDFGDSVGILGSYGTGAKLARDGATVVEDSNAFAMEWQVRPNVDGSLFDQEREPQFPTQCKLPDTATQESRRLRGGISEADAEAVCQYFEDLDARARCVFDVLATQDLEIAAAGAF